MAQLPNHPQVVTHTKTETNFRKAFKCKIRSSKDNMHTSDVVTEI